MFLHGKSRADRAQLCTTCVASDLQSRRRRRSGQPQPQDVLTRCNALRACGSVAQLGPWRIIEPRARCRFSSELGATVHASATVWLTRHVINGSGTTLNDDCILCFATLINPNLISRFPSVDQSALDKALRHNTFCQVCTADVEPWRL